MRVCYLRDHDRVYETYWIASLGAETMGSTYAMLDMMVGACNHHDENKIVGVIEVKGPTPNSNLGSFITPTPDQALKGKAS